MKYRCIKDSYILDYIKDKIYDIDIVYDIDVHKYMFSHKESNQKICNINSKFINKFFKKIDYFEFTWGRLKGIFI